jgi:hypothetical protein
MMPNESRQQNGYYPFYMVVMPHLLKPQKKEINIKHNPEAWILIESIITKPYSYRIGFFTRLSCY